MPISLEINTEKGVAGVTAYGDTSPCSENDASSIDNICIENEQNSLSIREQQDRLLDLLQPLDPKRSIKVQVRLNGPWSARPIGGAGPYCTRGILNNEVLLDFDHDDQSCRDAELDSLKHFLDLMQWQRYICATGGKGYHVHIFLDVESALPHALWERLTNLSDYDVGQHIRTYVGRRICDEAGLTISEGNVHGVDSQKFTFSSLENGSQVRMVGCVREDTGRTKVLFDKNGQPSPVPTKPPMLLDLSVWSDDLIEYLERQVTMKEHQKKVRIGTNGVQGLECIDKLMLRGAPQGMRNNLALPIATILCGANVPEDKASAIMDSYSQHCQDCDQQLIRANRTTLKSRYSKDINDRMTRTSCNKIRKELGQDFCDCSKCQFCDYDLSDDINVADRLMEIVLQNGVAEFFMDERNTPCARIKNKGHWEIMELSALTSWLSNEIYTQDCIVPSRTTISNVLGVLEGKAKHGGKRYELHNRVALQDGAIWYDLTNEKHQAVKIEAAVNGVPRWQVVDDVPILFRRYGNALPQDMPIREGSGHLDKMLGLANLQGDNLKITRVEWVCDLIPGIPHPADSYWGPHGSGKSTATLEEKQLIDPSSDSEFSMAKSEEDLVQALANNYIACIGNLSRISQEKSDILCQGVTGGTYTKRKLYTDGTPYNIKFRCIVRLNGINNEIDAPDLLDRTILKQVNPLPKVEDNVKVEAEKELWNRFYALRPYVLGEIFDMVSKAMEIYNAKEDHSNSARLSDWYAWAEIVAGLMGTCPQPFRELWGHFEAAKHEEAVDKSIVAKNLMKVANTHQYWVGTADELLDEMENQAGTEIRHDREWPKNSISLGRRLERYITDLREQDIFIHRTKWEKISDVAIRYCKGLPLYDRKDRIIFITNRPQEEWREIRSLIEGNGDKSVDAQQEVAE